MSSQKGPIVCHPQMDHVVCHLKLFIISSCLSSQVVIISSCLSSQIVYHLKLFIISSCYHLKLFIISNCLSSQGVCHLNLSVLPNRPELFHPKTAMLNVIGLWIYKLVHGWLLDHAGWCYYRTTTILWHGWIMTPPGGYDSVIRLFYYVYY